jgi:hypothetical protein
MYTSKKKKNTTVGEKKWRYKKPSNGVTLHCYSLDEICPDEFSRENTTEKLFKLDAIFAVIPMLWNMTSIENMTSMLCIDQSRSVKNE